MRHRILFIYLLFIFFYFRYSYHGRKRKNGRDGRRRQFTSGYYFHIVRSRRRSTGSRNQEKEKG